MKTISIMISIIFVFSFMVLARSTVGYIPIKNIYGMEARENAVYFSSEECEQSYLKINLTSFDIGVDKDRSFWKKYDPFLVIRVQANEKTFIKVLGGDTNAIQQDVQSFRARTTRNEPLFGPFPYKGEDIKVFVRLYIYETKNGLKNALKVVNNFSGLFPNQLSPFLKVSKTVVDSVENILVPNSEKDPIVDYEATWNVNRNDTNHDRPNIFKEGYFIIHSEEGPEIDYSKIFISDQSKVVYREGDQDFNLHQRNISYVVIEFQHFTSRDEDYTNFPFYKKIEEATRVAKGMSRLRDDDLKKKAAEDAENKFSEAMDLLYVDENFTENDKDMFEADLYKKLLAKITRYLNGYVGRKLPITCTNMPLYQTNPQAPGNISINMITPKRIEYTRDTKDIDKLVIANKFRKELIRNGSLQPGQMLSFDKLLGKMKTLSEAKRNEIYSFFKTEYEFKKTQIDSLKSSIDDRVDGPQIDIVSEPGTNER